MAAPDLEFFVGTYTREGEGGIHYVRLSDAGSGLGEQWLVARATNPSWICTVPALPDILVTVEEVAECDGPRLLTYSIGKENLAQLEAAPLPGSDPCQIGAHPHLPLVATAHYSDGSAALWTITAGTGEPVLRHVVRLSGTGPNAQRQSSSHAHCAIFIEGGDYLVLTDLGGDALYFFQLHLHDGPALAERQRLPLPPGSGPRHLAVGAEALYVVGELDERIYTIKFQDHAFVVCDCIAPFPVTTEDGALSALKLSPDGRFLYVASRNHNSIAWMKVEAGGRLSVQGRVDCGGSTPRDIAVNSSGRYLVSANQASDRVCVFALDPVTGSPEPLPGEVRIRNPACILFPDTCGQDMA